MAQPEFLLNFRWRKPARIFQASTLKAQHPEIRTVKYSRVGGFRFGHSTGTGRIDRGKLDITSPEVSSYVFRIAAKAEAIKSVLRRIRPHEAAILDDLDRHRRSAGAAECPQRTTAGRPAQRLAARQRGASRRGRGTAARRYRGEGCINPSR